MGGQTDVEVAQQTKDKWRVVPDEVLFYDYKQRGHILLNNYYIRS